MRKQLDEFKLRDSPDQRAWTLQSDTVLKDKGLRTALDQKD